MMDVPENQDAPGIAGTSDWIAFLKSKARTLGAEIELDQLSPGDTLGVETLHTTYVLKIGDNGFAEMTTNRVDRPAGKVRIMGCTFGQSSTIKPNHFFCGGNLELTLDDGKLTHRTTAIRKLWALSRQPSPQG